MREIRSAAIQFSVYRPHDLENSLSHHREEAITFKKTTGTVELDTGSRRIRRPACSLRCRIAVCCFVEQRGKECRIGPALCGLDYDGL
jgi:hypothetical protein